MRSKGFALFLLWFAVLLDGFDLVVLGATLPAMIEDPNWQLTAAEGTQISTAGLIGMTIGALLIGAATDKLGRRKVMIFSVAAFSILTLIMGFTYNFWVFLLLRFLAGVGLGGCLPTAISMVTELRGRAKAGSSTTSVMTGYHVGAVLTALLGILIIAPMGWHAMYIVGAIPGIILAPLMYFFLPESPQYLQATGRFTDAQRVAQQYSIELDEAFEASVTGETSAKKVGPATLVKAPYLRNSLAIWAASFMGLLLVYGLNTWLPQIMRQADYDMGNALGFLMVLNIGAVVGLVIAGQVSDKFTPRKSGLIWFALSAVFLALLAIRMPMPALYTFVFLTGVFVFSSQNLVYAFVGENHPSTLRATAMGMSAGIGRLGAISGPMLGGLLVNMGIADPWGFYSFALVGVLGLLFFSATKPLAQTRAAA